MMKTEENNNATPIVIEYPKGEKQDLLLKDLNRLKFDIQWMKTELSAIHWMKRWLPISLIDGKVDLEKLTPVEDSEECILRRKEVLHIQKKIQKIELQHFKTHYAHLIGRCRCNGRCHHRGSFDDDYLPLKKEYVGRPKHYRERSIDREMYHSLKV